MPDEPPNRRKALEDPLDYLPCSKIVERRKNRVIYSPEGPSANLYLIISGMIAVERVAGNGTRVLVDIYKTDELFGESALIGLCDTHEYAAAFDDVKLMMWTRTDVEALVLRQPRLGVALLQTFTQRTIQLAERIESFSSEHIEHRMARCLSRLCNRLGQPMDGGAIRMMPITHELLSRYVGTSREIVTLHMNQFQKLGYVRYSRAEIVVYPDALRRRFSISPIVKHATT
jgi:CRP/FNR family transcriptional regulator